MYKSILVPLDGSAFGEHALPLALTVAQRANAKLFLVHVHSPLTAVYSEIQVYDDSLDTQLLARNKVYLDSIVQKLTSHSSVKISSHVEEGEVTPTIAEFATKNQIDLVVMTSHGRGPLGRFWLGSVADELVRTLPMPLLLIRPHEEEPDWQDPKELKHFLLPLDGTHFAERMIESAVNLGSLMDADYTLLRAIKPVLPPSAPVGTMGMGHVAETMMTQMQEMQKHVEEKAKEYLEEIAGRLRARSLNVKTEVVVEEHPASAVLQRATLPEIDAVAIETHGRHGLSRLFMGSVTEKVLRGSHVPVLIHRGPDDDQT